MLNGQKEQMLEIIEQYKRDEDYRNYINSLDPSELSEIEQIALKDLIVTRDGNEVLYSDLSNYYEEYNPVDISTPERLRITCMNMAIAELLHSAMKDNNIGKYADFNLAEIKTRMKGDLFSKMDKPMVIEFIKQYNRSNPKFLPKHAKEYWDMYHGHIRNGVGTTVFTNLAQTFNTNIYLDELITKEKKNFFRRK